jgi:hypothetical protein
MTHDNTTPDFRDSAFRWYGFELNVIPVIPGMKRTAVKWNAWIEDFSTTAINDHWILHPDHEVGCIVGDDLIVFDADSPEAIAALVELEQRHGLSPGLVVTTPRGEHHYYRRAEGSNARSDAHSTETHPERIDVKTGRALVVLPPSSGRQVKQCTCDDVRSLSVTDQTFIDAVFRHNSRDAPRPPDVKPPCPQLLPSDLDQVCVHDGEPVQFLTLKTPIVRHCCRP